MPYLSQTIICFCVCVRYIQIIPGFLKETQSYSSQYFLTIQEILEG